MNRSRICHPDENTRNAPASIIGPAAVPLISRSMCSITLTPRFGYVLKRGKIRFVTTEMHGLSKGVHLSIKVEMPHRWPGVQSGKITTPGSIAHTCSLRLRVSCMPGVFPGIADPVLGHKVGPAEIVVFQDHADHLVFILDVHPAHK